MILGKVYAKRCMPFIPANLILHDEPEAYFASNRKEGAQSIVRSGFDFASWD
jgi:hypothetical protein